MTDTVLGVDVGTSGCRAAAYDPALREVAAATARYQVSLTGPGRAEIDADQVWAAVAGCLRTVNAQLDRSPQALAIAVQGETVLPVGADGEALAMAPISADARAVAETAAITDAVGARRLRVITGQPPHPMFSVGKIAWTRRIPGLWQRAAKFHCLGDFLALRLGVPPAIDYTMAARTMAFDCHRQTWSAEILDASGIPEKLMPPAAPVGTELGRLPPAIAGSLGFSQPPVLLAGAHDQACTLLGAGATEPGQAALSLGTSECLTVNVDGWPDSLTDTSFPVYRPWQSDRWIVLAGIPSGGATLDWLAGMLTGPGEDHALGRLTGLLPAEPAQVLALPHFAGSGTTENDPVSRGAFIGLSHSTSAGELLRAVLEASGFEVARSVAALTAAGIVISELRPAEAAPPQPPESRSGRLRRDSRSAWCRYTRPPAARRSSPAPPPASIPRLPLLAPASGRHHRCSQIREPSAGTSSSAGAMRCCTRPFAPSTTSRPEMMMPMSLVDRHIKQEILDCCRRSMQYGLNFNTQGNISVRVPASGLIAITPAGLDYDRMAADDIVVVDAEGRRVEGERQPSSETDVHLVVYRRRPDVNAIVRTEPVYSNVFGVLGRPIEAVLVNMVIYSRGPVLVMPFMPGNSTEFGEAMVKVLGTRNAVIWGNHGLMTVGADLTSAFRCNVAVETAARVQHAALCLGQPHVLSYAELNLTSAP